MAVDSQNLLAEILSYVGRRGRILRGAGGRRPGAHTPQHSVTFANPWEGLEARSPDEGLRPRSLAAAAQEQGDGQQQPCGRRAALIGAPPIPRSRWFSRVNTRSLIGPIRSLALGYLSSSLLDQPKLQPFPLVSLDQDVRPFETGSAAHLLANPSGDGGEVFLFGEASGAEKSGLPTSTALLGDPHNPALGTSDDVF